MWQFHPVSWLPSSLTSKHQHESPCPLHLVHLYNPWDPDLKASHTEPQGPTWLQSTSLLPTVSCPQRPLSHQPYSFSVTMNLQPSCVLSSVFRGHSPTLRSLPCKCLSLCYVSLKKHQLSNFAAALVGGWCQEETERGWLGCLDIYDRRSQMGPQLCLSMLPNFLINLLSCSVRRLHFPQVSPKNPSC